MADNAAPFHSSFAAILLDIEGTTTPIAFVYDVLFPYVRTRLASFLQERDADPEVAAVIAALEVERLRDQYASEAPGIIPYVLSLVTHDRKSTALKSLQGLIWRDGYRNGELHGEVFPDVPDALQTWHTHGTDVRIFSSGSVLAQRLLFSTTAAGDLTHFLSGYFDTTVGSKLEMESYGRIAEAIAQPANRILFISDVTRELDAARQRGLQTLLCVRPGNPQQSANGHRLVSSFDQITLDQS